MPTTFILMRILGLHLKEHENKLSLKEEADLAQPVRRGGVLGKGTVSSELHWFPLCSARACHLQHTGTLSHWYLRITFLIGKFCCLEALADILLWKFVVNHHLVKKLLVAGENFVNEFENCGHILRLRRNAVKFGLAMILKVRSEFNIQKFPGIRLWQIKPKVGKIIHKTDKLAAD